MSRKDNKKTRLSRKELEQKVEQLTKEKIAANRECNTFISEAARAIRERNEVVRQRDEANEELNKLRSMKIKDVIKQNGTQMYIVFRKKKYTRSEVEDLVETTINGILDEPVYRCRELEVKEVKRHAKVGEYVKIVEPYLAEGNYNEGDILEVVKEGCFSNVVKCKTPKESSMPIADSEYVVLENYKPA